MSWIGGGLTNRLQPTQKARAAEAVMPKEGDLYEK